VLRWRHVTVPSGQMDWTEDVARPMAMVCGMLRMCFDVSGTRCTDVVLTVACDWCSSGAGRTGSRDMQYMYIGDDVPVSGKALHGRVSGDFLEEGRRRSWKGGSRD
jgi:hypothetical protein